MALRSVCKYRIAAAAIDRSGNISSIASNSPRFMWRGGGDHAERACLRRCAPGTVVAMVLIRVGKGGTMRPIDPCRACAKLLLKLGVKVLSL